MGYVGYMPLVLDDLVVIQQTTYLKKQSTNKSLMHTMHNRSCYSKTATTNTTNENKLPFRFIILQHVHRLTGNNSNNVFNKYVSNFINGKV